MNWLYFPSGLATFFFLLFPDGHLQSRRWRMVAWFAGGVTAVALALSMLQVTLKVTGSPVIRNPIGIAANKPVRSLFDRRRPLRILSHGETGNP